MVSTWNPPFLSIHSMLDGYHLTEFNHLPRSFCRRTQSGTHLFSLLFHSYFDWVDFGFSPVDDPHLKSKKCIWSPPKLFLIIFNHCIDFSCLTTEHGLFLFRGSLCLVCKKYQVTLIEFRHIYLNGKQQIWVSCSQPQNANLISS